MNSSPILLIRTGGTVDAAAYDDPKNPPEFVTNLPPEQSLLAAVVGTHDNVEILEWSPDEEERFVKDSQLFTDEDISALAEIIKSSDQRFFLISHGTDAMVKNATRLEEKLGDTDKVVAFFGAIVPLSMSGSDGVETLAYAAKHINEQDAGVYVVGRNLHTKRFGFYEPKSVKKDRETSLAESRFVLKPSTPDTAPRLPALPGRG